MTPDKRIEATGARFASTATRRSRSSRDGQRSGTDFGAVRLLAARIAAAVKAN